MIYGIGIDLINIGRMRLIVEKWGETFLKKIFTDHEISHCYRKKDPYPSLAVRFAAKEALIKAMGSEISASLTDIEVVNTPSGKPTFIFGEKINAHFTKRSIRVAHLSLSHDREYGIASVILEQ